LPRAPPLAPSLSLPLADVPVLAATISTLTSPVALEATAGALSVLVLLSQLSSDPGPADVRGSGKHQRLASQARLSRPA
jgi:hypothetical protein